LETLLKLNQKVVGLDNFFAGYQHNLDMVQANWLELWANFKFINGDVRDLDCCKIACTGVDYVLHQAALGSVPRSIAEPILSNECNITGHLNMLVAAVMQLKALCTPLQAQPTAMSPTLPKQEDLIGKPLSPYAYQIC
jgi:UDP-glucose 4-epimerase